MRFTQVSYQRTFNLGVGTFESEKLGVEIEILEGESPKDALDAAKQLVEEQHKENNKSRYNAVIVEENFTKLSEDFVGDLSTLKPIPPPKQTISEQIASCTDIKILESYKLIVKKNPELQKVYDETMDKLTNK